MANSLMTGVSGLIAHQRMLNVVGNNLANMNTIGYKVQRVRFTDLIYENIRPAASGSNNDAGGINPNQIGSGVKVGQIDRRFGQGSLELSGGLFDFAIQGDGFFTISDGNRNLFSRAGSFALDKNQSLVDPTNGSRVQRFGTVGEGTDGNPAFQTPGDSGIRIPFGAVIPGEASTMVDIAGNLNSNMKGPRPSQIRSGAAFTVGTNPADESTLVEDLDGIPTDGIASLEFTGITADGSTADFSVTIDGTTTLGTVLDDIRARYPGTTVDMEAGRIVMTNQENGETLLSLDFSGKTPSDTAIPFSDQQMVSVDAGSDGDTYSVDARVVDSLGRNHTVSLLFTRRPEPNRWDVSATIPESEGEVVDGVIEDLRFDEDGLSPRVFGTDVGDAAFTFTFNDISEPQTVSINFDADGSSNGLTQTAIKSSIQYRRDGFEPGTITAISVSTDGVVQGVASNGQTVPIAQLAIAFFENNKGLQAVGDNFFEQSLNSGEPQLGTAGSGSRGIVLGGQLEGSNVDVALEFTQLIVAQRGFSANARTITISNEVLEELTNVIR
ncbi:MAG: flagellar hook-basal body complex protein [Planctomycetales bacterium]|nr:flagellar hook-basal body complex protein [Planctomycetales bacterium]